jgi:hypothetical protein
VLDHPLAGAPAVALAHRREDRGVLSPINSQPFAGLVRSKLEHCCLKMESSCAGEDPRIHPVSCEKMGCRVKPGNDGGSA